METFTTAKPSISPDTPHYTVHNMRHSPNSNAVQNTLTKTVLARHSTRIFHEDLPVPMAVLEQCFELAQYSPSSTNIQPWRLVVTTGAKLDRLREIMVETASDPSKESVVPPIPAEFKQYRSDVGHALYGPSGYNIPHSDREGTAKARMRNYRFFDAPMVVTIGIPENLAQADILSVGLYVQTLVLLLTERGLGTCLQVSTAGYPDVIRKELGISDDTTILCTLAIGYEDEAQHINVFQMGRDKWRQHVSFVTE